MTHLDTSFLVDLLREASRKKTGPATSLLHGLESEEIAVSVHVLCELYAGAEFARAPALERKRVDQLCQDLTVEYPDERFPETYARLLVALERAGQRISTMDLLIATAAVRASASLVTRNVKHFSRVPGLDVLGY